jgi:hypothetical protein
MTLQSGCDSYAKPAMSDSVETIQIWQLRRILPARSHRRMEFETLKVKSLFTSGKFEKSFHIRTGICDPVESNGRIVDNLLGLAVLRPLSTEGGPLGDAGSKETDANTRVTESIQLLFTDDKFRRDLSFPEPARHPHHTNRMLQINPKCWVRLHQRYAIHRHTSSFMLRSNLKQLWPRLQW